jgi:hypothetical protein
MYNRKEASLKLVASARGFAVYKHLYKSRATNGITRGLPIINMTKYLYVVKIGIK